jgi:hypothetical protein
VGAKLADAAGDIGRWRGIRDDFRTGLLAAAACEEGMPWYESRWSILVSTSEVEKMGTAKLFRNGRSQAVRLPKEFRFEGEELSIRREGEAVILEPLRPRTWPKGYWRRWGKASLDLDLVGPLPAGGRPIELDEP